MDLTGPMCKTTTVQHASAQRDGRGLSVLSDPLSAFPEGEDLRRMFSAFRAEALQAPPSPAQDADTRLVLRRHGVNRSRTLRHMPLMAGFLSRNPGILHAAIVRMPPGTARLSKGPWLGDTACYQLLLDGKPGVVIAIDGALHAFREGEDLMYDPTAAPEIRNGSDSGIVLLALRIQRRRAGRSTDAVAMACRRMLYLWARLAEALSRMRGTS